MRFSRGERSRWLSSVSIRISYDPFDPATLTGFCRPPPFAACVLDYFRAISYTAETFQVAEMRLLLENPDQFYPRVEDDEIRLFNSDTDGDDTLPSPAG